MPIQTQHPLKLIPDVRFDELDYEIMGRSYDIQNDFGQLFTERAYQHELADRMRDKADTELEVKATVTHKQFSKTFSLDMVVERGVVLELKVAKAIAAEHRSQLLQYLMLCGLERGKIVNFGAAKVEGEWVTTRLTQELRRQLGFSDYHWIPTNEESNHFKQLLMDLLRDIGGFLSLNLYNEAITCLLGGQQQVVKPIAVIGTKRNLCLQNCHLLTPTTAYKITCLTSAKGIDVYRKQLGKFLSKTELSTIQWVNLNHHDVVFESVTK